MDPENGQSTPFWTSCERQKRGDFIAETVVIECGQPMCSSQPLAGLESLIRVRQTQSAFHRSAQRNASVIAVRVCNKDRSPARIHGCDAAPTPTGFAEVVGDDIPNTSSYVERGSFP